MNNSIRYPTNATLTFKNGFLNRVEIPVKKKMLSVPIRDVEFLSDILNWLDTKKIPMNEVMQWITRINKDISVEIVNTDTIKLLNVKL